MAPLTYLEPYKKLQVKNVENIWRIFQFYCRATGNFVTISGLLREKFQYRDFTISWWWIAVADLFVTAGYNVVNKHYNKYVCRRLLESEAAHNRRLLGKFCWLSNAAFKTFSLLQNISPSKVVLTGTDLVQTTPFLANSSSRRWLIVHVYLSSYICLSPFPLGCYVTLT